jgi:hypothetical protein
MNEKQPTHLMTISAVCTRPNELAEMAKELRRFARSIQREFDYDMKVDLTVVVNPHGTDTKKQDSKSGKIGFDIEIKRDDDDGDA